MKLVIATLSIVLLVGCQTHVPISPKFPTPPDVLMEACGPLKTIDKDTVLLSEFMQTVRSNYEKYHNCADLVSEWQNWYKEQKSIYDNLNK
jgi:uncharacterized protein YcfL